MSCPKNSEFIKNANINCAFEHGHELVEKYWQKELAKIKNVEFPYPEISLSRCYNEWQRLKASTYTIDSRNSSSILNHFHKSIQNARRGNSPSPYEYWYRIKEDEEEFKKYLFNRLTRSDWFKDHPIELESADVPLSIYYCGLTTSGIAPHVSVFKPVIAKYLVQTYLNEFDTVFDPFSGFSGRMLGALACGKNYIGQDINATSVKESNELYDFLKTYDKQVKSCSVTQKDLFESSGTYECLLTCSPYAGIEKWNFNDEGVCVDSNLTCEQWIDECLMRFKCKKYVFVTDESCGKYEQFTKDKIQNKGYWSKKANKNYERVIVMTEDDVKKLNEAV